MKSERLRLTKEIDEAVAKESRLRDEINETVAKEMRLRAELRVLESEAEEAIAVEVQSIASLEQQEAVVQQPASEGPALAPFTWSAWDGLSDSFWSSSPATPWVVADPS